jgi:hypothetical protein
MICKEINQAIRQRLNPWFGAVWWFHNATELDHDGFISTGASAWWGRSADGPAVSTAFPNRQEASTTA